MTMTAVALLNTLESLEDQEFKDFKWHLQQPGILGAHTAIPVSKLENAERRDTVNLMEKTYVSHALTVAKKVLEQIHRKDLVKHLSGTNLRQKVSVEANGVGETSENSGTEDVIPVPKPQSILHYQLKLQSNLHDRFMCVQEGCAKKKDEQRLDHIYTELYVTTGGEANINMQHEVRQIEAVGKPAETEEQMKPSDIFKSSPGKYRPLRTVLTIGNAGSGKTILVRKFVLDVATGRANQDVHLIFPFTFRQLNLLKREKFSLAELIHKCIIETKDIKEEALNYIFTSLQSSGNTNYEKSRFKLLFVLDGLDESQLQLHCSTNNNRDADFDVTESTSVDVLVTNLIQRNLLPSARVWITTRPAAVSQIHSDFVDRVTEVRPFTDLQKDEYFRKQFRDGKNADTIISHIKTSQSLHIMCHIPIFCWITTKILKDMLKTREKKALPTTLTEMYIHFLVVQSKLNNMKYDGGDETYPHCNPEGREMIESLGKLAFEKLQTDDLIFYESDLTNNGIDIRAASVHSGVFTQIYKEESGFHQEKVFCFVHLTVQEFLAALYVHLTFINSGVNLLSEAKTRSQKSKLLTNNPDPIHFYQTAVTKTLESSNGHLDMFLRFLLGLSLQTNQTLLRGLVTHTGSNTQTNQEIVTFIKKRITMNRSPERNINLFHCLYELKDCSLVEQIHRYLKPGGLSKKKLSLAQWSALGFILQLSDLDVFDLKKYRASEEVLLRLMSVVKASNKALLSNCNLSERSCEALSSVISSPSCSLRELDLSNNDLQDSGVKLLCDGLKSSYCALESLRLSGCMITEEGCTSLASALRSNPSHLRELDLSYNHPGDSGVKLLSAGLEDPNWRLDTLRVKHHGEQWLKPGLRKYVCELTLDTNTVNRQLKLSDNNRKVTEVTEKQPYADHPERFSYWPQLLCRNALKGRSYWEVEWEGTVYISVTYRGIRRRGHEADCWFGRNNQSWTLRCSDDGNCYSVYHNKSSTNVPFSVVSHRVGVYVDRPGGTLSFYTVSSDSLVCLHTFNTTFTEPLHPGFGFGYCSTGASSVSLCST